jgi:hypothetical protein
MGKAARSLEIIFMATTTTIDATRIKPHMPVVCSDGGQFATVDHTDPGNMIKLTKDASGQHHWIPMSWVTRVDEHVHVDRPGKQAMQEWSTSNPSA